MTAHRFSVQAVFALTIAALGGGCQLNEVRSTNEFGTEWRHDGSSGTESERYTVKEGVDFRWDNGVNTEIAYRRRDENEGGGDHDDGVFVNVSFPIWKRPTEPDKNALRIAELERRLAALEVATGVNGGTAAGETEQ